LENVLESKSGEWTLSRNMTTETGRARGLGRKTREEIGKGNQMAANPEIPDRGVKHTSGSAATGLCT